MKRKKKKKTKTKNVGEFTKRTKPAENVVDRPHTSDDFILLPENLAANVNFFFFFYPRTQIWTSSDFVHVELDYSIRSPVKNIIRTCVCD